MALDFFGHTHRTNEYASTSLYDFLEPQAQLLQDQLFCVIIGFPVNWCPKLGSSKDKEGNRGNPNFILWDQQITQKIFCLVVSLALPLCGWYCRQAGNRISTYVPAFILCLLRVWCFFLVHLLSLIFSLSASLMPINGLGISLNLC